MAINVRAAGDSRHARTGKDGAFYNKDGVMLASVETFTSNVTWNNAKYNVLGDPQEHETSASYAVNLTMTQVVVEDDAFIQELFEAMESGITPCWDFQGTLTGLNGSEERVVYRDCLPSGQVDLQNIAVGETSEPAFYRLIMITNRVLHTQYPEIFISGGKPEWKKRK